MTSIGSFWIHKIFTHKRKTNGDKTVHLDRKRVMHTVDIYDEWTASTNHPQEKWCELSEKLNLLLRWFYTHLSHAIAYCPICYSHSNTLNSSLSLLCCLNSCLRWFEWREGEHCEKYEKREEKNHSWRESMTCGTRNVLSSMLLLLQKIQANMCACVCVWVRLKCLARFHSLHFTVRYFSIIRNVVRCRCSSLMFISDQ